MAHVVHVVPYDGVGGVEVAARTVEDGSYQGFTFRKLYLFDKSEAKKRSLSPYVKALKELLENPPTHLIASLWRSCVVLVLLKFLRPSTKAITFLHFPKSVHLMDYLFSRTALSVSDEIWVDSKATIERVPKRLQNRCKVVSMLTQRYSEPTPKPAQARFIFWGRICEQKGVDRALKIFAEVRDAHQDAEFFIIGPDGGMFRQVLIESRGIGGVHLWGPRNKDEIFALARTCSFYLQPSRQEGAAMSVMEAMQMGLVPIVTPVGDIKNYCNSKNSVMASSHFELLYGVARLMVSPQEYQDTAENAYRTFSDRPLYRDDILAYCERLVMDSPSLRGLRSGVLGPGASQPSDQ